MKKPLSLLIIVVFSLISVAKTTGQEPPKIVTIGFLTNGARPSPLTKVLMQALEELGYVDGKNIRVERRSANGKRERLAGLAAELVALEPAVIVPSGPTTANYVLKATRTIPVVMPNAGADPVKYKFVKSWGVPGGNATGLAIGVKGLRSKRMQLLKETLPAVRNVIFLNPRRPRPTSHAEYQKAADALGIKLEVTNVRSNSDIEQFFLGLATKSPDALIIERNTLTLRNAKKIGEWVVKNRIATMNNQRIFVETGGLISYGVNYPANWRRAAIYIDKILKGANPATLPVEPPRLEMVVNLKTAEKLGVKIPPEILLEANEVMK